MKSQENYTLSMYNTWSNTMDNRLSNTTDNRLSILLVNRLSILLGIINVLKMKVFTDIIRGGVITSLNRWGGLLPIINVMLT